MRPLSLKYLTLAVGFLPLLLFGQVTATFSVDMPESPLVVDAGPDQAYDGINTLVLGGAPTATGGFGEYTYLWTPEEYLDNPTAPNPTIINLDGPTNFSLTVNALGALCEKESQVFVDYTLSLSDPSQSDIGVFPNPFNELIQLKSNKVISEVMVTDMTGKTLLVKRNLQVASYQMETAQFTGGVYFFVIRFIDGSTSVKKLCKIL